MITKWRLQRFKAVRSAQEFTLGPLTILTGANSSGKSSIIQSMLLICQTLSSNVVDRHLVLNGNLLRLGEHDDVLSTSNDDAIKEFYIGFDIRFDFKKHGYLKSFYSDPRYQDEYIPNITRGIFTADLFFGPEGKDDRTSFSKVRRLHSYLKYAHYIADIETYNSYSRENFELAKIHSLKINKRHNHEIDYIINEFNKFYNPRFAPSERLLEYAAIITPSDPYNKRTFKNNFTKLEYESSLIGVHLKHFLPSRLWLTCPIIFKRCNDIINNLMLTPDLYKLLNQIKSDSLHDPASKAFADIINDLSTKANISELEFISSIQRRENINTSSNRDSNVIIHEYAPEILLDAVIDRLSPDTIKQIGIEPVNLPYPLLSLLDALNETFLTMRYLGPLRDDPKPVYGIASSADPSDVGVKGEFTAAVLDLYADQLVEFVDPGDTNGSIQRMKLRQAVITWLSHFDIAESYHTNEEGKLGHRLEIRQKGTKKDLDLTNVGVGVSQVLPILVMSLVSEPGAVLLFEQPELHLHPKVQSILADFFLAIIKTGRQCIVETHSEYLINRLRLRVSESPWESPLQDQITMYFVEREDGNSIFKHVKINEYGSIPEWPKGFFDQGPKESDRILKAAAAKRKLKVSPDRKDATSDREEHVDA